MPPAMLRPPSRSTWRSGPDHESPDVRANLRRILLLSHAARCNADYEFLDKYTHRANYFSDMRPRERVRYLQAAKGIELDDGDALFRIGDRADAFYCILYGAMSVVMDFARMPAPTLNEFEEIVSRARVHSSLLHPGGGLDASSSMHGASYVVRAMKPLECFGDVGLLLTNQQRTASVVATEKTLLMKIDRDTFLEMRACNTSRELREKMVFLTRVPCVDHWDDDSVLRLCGRMEKVVASYNDVIVTQGDAANAFYFVAHGECRLVRQFKPQQRGAKPCDVEVCTIGSPNYFGAYEVVFGLVETAFSVLVSSPTAILFRVDRVDFRQTLLKDAQTDQSIRADARQLAERIDESKVLRELDKEARWVNYKRELVDSILAKHRAEHVAVMGPRPDLTTYRTAREPPLPFLPTTKPLMSPVRPGGAQTAREPSVRGSQRLRVTVDGKLLPRKPPTSPRNRGNDKKWLEWAKKRAEAIVTGQDGKRIDDEAEEAPPVSSIRWGKTAQIMGGLEGEQDKVVDAIVSLFNSHPADNYIPLV